jgi:hypothetical protein
MITAILIIIIITVITEFNTILKQTIKVTIAIFWMVFVILTPRDFSEFNYTIKCFKKSAYDNDKHSNLL